MKKIFKNLLKPLAAAVSFLAPLKVWAQTTAGPIGSGLDRINRRGLFSNQGLSGARSVSELISIVIEYLLLFAGMVAVVFLIIGGYWYITSAGNAEQAEKGKGTLINAIIGIVIIVLSYVIVRVITNLVGYDQV